MPILLALGLAVGCGGDDPVGRCHVEGCPTGEYCALFGSDVTSEPSVYRCAASPPACAASTATCECLDAAVTAGETSADVNLAFCLAEGGCDASGEHVVVTCPGG
jgi:hypothetical protein